MSPYNLNTFPGEIQHPSGNTLTIDRSRLVVFNLEALAALSLGRDGNTESIRIAQKLLKQRRTTGIKKATSFAADLGFQLETGADQHTESKVNQLPWQLWVRSDSGNDFQQQDLTKPLDRFSAQLGWRNLLAAPVYRLPKTAGTTSLISPLPHVLGIKLREVSSDQFKSLVERFADRYGLQIADISKYLPNSYQCFVVRDFNAEPVYRLQSVILQQEKDFVTDVFLDFLPFFIPTALYAPDDKYYKWVRPKDPYQWNLERINVAGGWNILPSQPTLGSGVVVAVIDDGCDLTGHPDLPSTAFVGGITIDYTGGQTPGGDAVSNQSHGTQCAGIIAARTNNGGIGLAGIAGDSKIMPIRLDAYNSLSVSAAIGYAKLHGARVISMSFGGQTASPLAYSEPAVRDAVSDALRNNVTLCAATMNNGTQNFIPYPAAYPGVIACGASLINEDMRKANSNYGQDPATQGMLSVVAPGERIITTANSGEGDSSDGNYSLTFGDTSAATPHVAALAALMISIKPRITSQQVKDIIEQTADKTPSTTLYTVAKLNGLWNPDLGYGRINIATAVDRARLLP